MTGRATTQAISTAELTEGDSDTVRIRHRLEALADASNRTPRLVTPITEDISVEPSAKAPATKRSRAASAAGRAKSTKTAKAKATNKATKVTEVTGEQEAPDNKQAATSAPPEPPAISTAPTMAAAVPVTPERSSRAFAFIAALALASVAAYFSVTGMAEIFPGAPVAVMVFAATMEAGKLVIAGWLAAHWRRVGWSMRAVMVTLVAGLALINAAGVFGKLVEAHVTVAASTHSSVTERIEAVDARVKAQSAVIADLDGRVAQIDRAVDEFDAARPGDPGPRHSSATARDAGWTGYAAAGGNGNAGRTTGATRRAGRRTCPHRSIHRSDAVSRVDGRRRTRSRGAMADTLDGAVLRSRGNRTDRGGEWLTTIEH